MKKIEPHESKTLLRPLSNCTKTLIGQSQIWIWNWIVTQQKSPANSSKSRRAIHCNRCASTLKWAPVTPATRACRLHISNACQTNKTLMSTAICRQLNRIKPPTQPTFTIRNCQLQPCKIFNWLDSMISEESAKKATYVLIIYPRVRQRVWRQRTLMHSVASRHFLVKRKPICRHWTMPVALPNKFRNGVRTRPVSSTQKSIRTMIEQSNRWQHKAVKPFAISWRWRHAIYCKYSPKRAALTLLCFCRSSCWMRHPLVASPIRQFGLARWPFVDNWEMAWKMWHDGVSKNGKQKPASFIDLNQFLIFPNFSYIVWGIGRLWCCCSRK